jgi:hypothetical protein
MENKNTDNELFFFTKRIIRIGIWVYLGLGLFLFVFQSSYIYYPDKTDFNNCPAFQEAEQISSGFSRGYLTKRSPEKLIIYYHGNAGRACDRKFMDSFFEEKNYSTYFVEYPGYAETGNEPSMAKLIRNVDDTMDFFKNHNFENITIVGESVGVGPAAYHALNSKIDNLVLISAYNNLASVAFSHYPIYPMSLLLVNNFTPDVWLDTYQGPVSVILAGNDEIIPNKLGRKLYEGLSSDLKKIYTIEGALHNSIYEKAEFYSVLNSALEI